MGSHQELLQATACNLVDRLRRNDIAPHDLLDALEARITEVDGKVNALPTLCLDRARKHADALSGKPADQRGLLAGLPVPIKDLTEVKGVLTTQGSPIFRDHIPTSSDVLVEHLEANGGVIYAKSNTPEFGAGANTFNEVFGATRNPWNLALSAAGSSGGAAAALASGTARFQFLQDREFPDHRGWLVTRVIRHEQHQPVHGTARPLPVHPVTRSHRQAGLHP